MRWMLMFVVTALPVAAEGWQVLDAAGIVEALSARTVIYAGGQVQDFRANGRTLFQNGDRSEWGYWRVEGDRYCSQWPPREVWTCYDVARAGNDLRFTGAGGDESTARYVDLN